MCRLLLLLCFCATGCARLAPGDVTKANTPRPQICLIRGYQDWYSTGIDQLTKKLQADGFAAQAYREEQWGDLADTLSKNPRPPIILIGFSYGADDVILIARKLNDAHLPVDLLITIDPVTPSNIPPNVKRDINFYEPNGFWDLFPWLRGIPVTADSNAPAQNINVRDRPDLDEPNTSHATIAANQKIHKMIEELVAQSQSQFYP